MQQIDIIGSAKVRVRKSSGNWIGVATKRNSRCRFSFACRFGTGCWGVHSSEEHDHFRQIAALREVEGGVRCVYCHEGCCERKECRGQTAMHPASSVVAKEGVQVRKVTRRKRRGHRRKRSRNTRRRRRRSEVLRLVKPVSPQNSMLTEVIEAVEEVHQEALWKLERVGAEICENGRLCKPVKEKEEELAQNKSQHTDKFVDCESCWELDYPLEAEWERVFGRPSASDWKKGRPGVYSDQLTDFVHRMLKTEEGKALWDQLTEHEGMLFPKGGWHGTYGLLMEARRRAYQRHSEYDRLHQTMTDTKQ